MPAPPRSRPIPLNLTHRAFPHQPGPAAAAWIPPAFNSTDAWHLIVHFHGFHNCVLNAISNISASCTPSQPARVAYALGQQLDASAANAVLILPEVAYDEASADAGALLQAGVLGLLAAEALAELGINGAPSSVVVSTHSGGYRAAAAAAQVGWSQPSPVQELWLLDSLYANQSEFESWMLQNLQAVCTPPYRLRFVSVYTDFGGTLPLNQATADAVARWPGVGKACLFDDRTTDTLTPQQYELGMLFKRSALTHDQVPEYYFKQLLLTLPPR